MLDGLVASELLDGVLGGLKVVARQKTVYFFSHGVKLVY